MDWGWKRPQVVARLNPPLQTGPPRAHCQRQLVNAFKQDNSAASLGNLCCCLVTVTGKKHFLMFRGNIWCFRLCQLPACEGTLLVHVQLGVYQHVRFFSTELLSSCGAPNGCNSARGSSPARVGLCVSRISSLSRCLWMAAREMKLRHISHFSQFCIISKFAEGQLHPTIKI